MNGERWGGKSEGPLTFSYWSQHRNISEAMNYLQLPWFILQPISPHLGRKMEVVKFQTAPTPVFRLLRHRRGGGTRGWAGESIRWRGQVGAEGKRTEETEPGAEGGGSSSRNDRGTTEQWAPAGPSTHSPNLFCIAFYRSLLCSCTMVQHHTQIIVTKQL